MQDVLLTNKALEQELRNQERSSNNKVLDLEDQIRDLKARAQSASKTDKTASDTSIDKSEKREKILKEKILLRENEIK